MNINTYIKVLGLFLVDLKFPDGGEQDFMIKNEPFLKNELFFKDLEDVYSRSAHPSASYTYWLCSNERTWQWEQFNTLVETIDQLPTPLQQIWRFPRETNRFLATFHDHLDLFFKPL